MKETLVQIFNALQNIPTKGESTLIMADCLRALADVINKMGEQKGEADEQRNDN